MSTSRGEHNDGDDSVTTSGSFRMVDLKNKYLGNWIKKVNPLRRGLSVEADTSDKRRVVHVNMTSDASLPQAARQQKKNKFCSNEISTSKYKLYSFIFRFLFEQFNKMSNLFFLLTALIQQIPDVSPSGRYTTLVPLMFILFVSLVKELIEDVKRRASDHRTNNKKTLVLRRDKSEWVTTRWRHIKVGDIVRVESNQSFPADLLFLSSSEPNSICFIETSNLDGETNLKIRPSLTLTQDLKSLNELKSLSCEIEYEFPNQHLYQFVGNFKTHDRKVLPIGPDQILLRGSQLRNTGWINGIVLYTGGETKLMKNSRQPPMKRSKVEMMLNKQIFILFFILIGLSLLSTIISVFWEASNSTIHWYLGSQQSDQSSFIFTFLTFMLLYQNLIPISLPVTLEVVKFIQAFFINWDEEMYDEENDFYAVARTSNLNEELGLVKYVFSDKTGTLTRNQMELKKCSIAGVVYDKDSQESNYQVLVSDMSSDEQFESNAVEFLNVLAVCHSANPEIIDGVLHYQASSPDESAFLIATKEIGVKFHTRLQDQVQINFLGQEKCFTILNVLEFNSVRKRMSVIVREESTNKIKLFCKGADEALLPLLDPQQAQFKAITWQHLEFFAREGLRTLVLAYREIDEPEYQAWNQKFIEAATSLSNRSENLQNVAELIETELIVLGSTAIEDKLQIGVPETISKLRTAGIKVWVLTGDKTETAINIGYSCKLISPDTNLIFMNGTSQDVTQVLKEWAEFVDSQKGMLTGNALVIEGQSLKYALHKDNEDNFYKVASTVDVVIYSRATPKSKAQVVDFIRTRTNDVTLAIGDGANDVSMIQTAHLGIGIQGKEGTNALAASDYAIGQFRFLARLLFVHGTLNYTRVNKVIFYSIYKNICLYMMNFWSGFLNGFSGQLFVDRWLVSLYNMIFTSWPPMGLGLYERPLNDTTLLNYPELYKELYEKSLRSVRKFWMYIGNSLIHSAMIFGFTIGILHHDIFAQNGTIGDHIFVGNYAFHFCCIIVCIKASLETDSWTFFTHLFNLGSILVWIVFLVVYSHTWPWLDVGADMVGMDDNLLISGLFWMATIFVCITVLLPDLVFKTIKRIYFKSLFQSIQEEEIRKSKSSGATTTTVDEAEEGRKQSRIMSILSRENIARKTTILLKRIRGPKVGSRPPHSSVYRGYAFSQEENGKISQSKLILKQP